MVAPILPLRAVRVRVVRDGTGTVGQLNTWNLAARDREIRRGILE